MSFLSLLGFGAQDAQAPPPNANEALVQRETLEELRNGIVSDRCIVQGYLCKQGEKTIFFFKEVKHYRSAIHSEHLGRSAGASVRIAKGFWIRTGANKSHSVQHSSLDYQGDGMLILTSKAISFIGAASTRIPFTKILALEPFTDGFSLDTDYARNNKHMFGNIHPQNMIFLRSALGLMTGGGEVSPPEIDSPKVAPSRSPPPLPSPKSASPATPPPLPVIKETKSSVTTPGISLKMGDYSDHDLST